MMTGAVVRANNNKKKSLTLNFVHVQTDVYACVCLLEACWLWKKIAKQLCLFYYTQMCVFAFEWA